VGSFSYGGKNASGFAMSLCFGLYCWSSVLSVQESMHGDGGWGRGGGRGSVQVTNAEDGGQPIGISNVLNRVLLPGLFRFP
jgi:hypothetical protein